ncbi:hypothetical protein N9L68_08565 [bacterium]|nr:hypothetical protein [bacterium]
MRITRNILKDNFMDWIGLLAWDLMKEPRKDYTGLLFPDPDTTSDEDNPWFRDPGEDTPTSEDEMGEQKAETAEPQRHLPMNLRKKTTSTTS